MATIISNLKHYSKADPSLGGEYAISNILSSAGIGLWSYNLEAEQLRLCNVSCQLTGLQEKTGVKIQDLLRKLARFQRSGLLSSIKMACSHHGKFEEELVLADKQGSPQTWLKITGELYQQGSKPAELTGTISDITAIKQEDIRRKDLLAFLSHELRNPLSTIKLYVQSAAKIAEMERKDIVDDMLQRADKQIVRMTKLIDNFLLLSQLEHTRLVVQKTCFDLAAHVYQVAEEMSFMHPEYTFKFELSDALWVEADQDKITQVLVNYLSNAVKFSPKKGAIYIACRSKQGSLQVSVRDEGLGISAEDQELLFNRYCRVNTENSIRTKGYGLGLYLSREIIGCHQGKVWVKSEPGRGSTFLFSLPDHHSGSR